MQDRASASSRIGPTPDPENRGRPTTIPCFASGVLDVTVHPGGSLDRALQEAAVNGLVDRIE